MSTDKFAMIFKMSYADQISQNLSGKIF